MILKYVIYRLLIKKKKKKKKLNSFTNTYISPIILFIILFIVIFVNFFFSKLKLIKLYFRSIGLGILSIENEILAKLQYKKIIVILHIQSKNQFNIVLRCKITNIY